ncbi:MAG: bifunctional (p)ppGpp synthetase/guanosine-3',5'-bis(diphosphate) 3'-pyrophosphohydrolase [Rhizobiaceae bacterium]|nr:bifunctional (p)ppGpp synthetase/guanosine-3',5'-bis(diphosphate) 3'-pyrophosphohydrolase [Rhizobiaceae bacterium]
MMRQYELVERVSSYNKDVNEALLNKAYVYAMQKHGTQLRASGDPYFSHPLEVAAILTEMKLDEETIAVALLHDTIEDTDATRKEIDDKFGERIGALVEGLTKIKRLELVSKKAEQGENLRRLLLAVSDDIRVLLVKLADRLHNMRTLNHVKIEKRARIAQETMEIYAPLAGRMGMQSMRDELEELAFSHINPETHETITKHLEELAEKNKNLISQITSELSQKLEQSKIPADVSSRRKRPFSVSRKMEKKELAFEQLSDIYGFRIIVESVEDCYRALGLVHTTWSFVPGRIKDYISTPKQNGYKSIHTTVIGPKRQRVELQIRTRKMHEIAEYGVAAHALYKDLGDGAVGISNEIDAYATLRKTIEQLAHSTSPEEFLEHTKLELFLDQVFCFTPKGRIIALPHGATPIDFAYAVHTDVGNSCVGCKINGQLMPVITELQNGDEVEIIRSKSQTPPSAWESVVVTGKARAAIRRSTREAVRLQYSSLGARILERGFEREGKVFEREDIKEILPKLARQSIEDVLTDVGRGELPSLDVIQALYPNYLEERAATRKPPKEEGWFGLKTGAGLLFKIPGLRRRGQKVKSGAGGLMGSIPIRGIKGDLPVRFSPSGGAVPGDRIVGILEPGKGITIYPAKSAELRKFKGQTDRWIDVQWDIVPENAERFPATIKLSAVNEPGALATIADTIASNESNIQNMVMSAKSNDFTQMVIDLEVWDLSHLERIIKQLAKKSAVSKIIRIIE